MSDMEVALQYSEAKLLASKLGITLETGEEGFYLKEGTKRLYSSHSVQYILLFLKASEWMHARCNQ